MRKTKDPAARKQSANIPQSDIAALVDAGHAAWFAGKQLEALECYRQAVGALTPDAAPKVVARVLSYCALAEQRCGDPCRALEIYEELEPKLDPEDPETETILRQWAIALETDGQYPQARALYARIMPSADSDRDSRLKWHHAVGLLDWSEGRFREAAANLRQATALMPRASGSAGKVLAVLGNDAQLSLVLGDDARAYRLVQRMIKIRARVESVPLESETNLAKSRASLAAHRHDHVEEAKIYREALDWLNRTAPGENYHALEMLGRYVSALHHTGGHAEALPHLREQVARAPASLAWVAGLHLASVEVDQGDIGAARQTLASVLAAIVGKGEPEREAEIIAILAAYFAQAGKRDAAIFLGKLSIGYFADMLKPLPKTAIVAALREIRRISDLTVQGLRGSGRYEEAQIVENIHQRMRRQALINRPQTTEEPGIDMIPMDSTEKAAQVGWVLARQALAERRKNGDVAATHDLALQVVDALAGFETGSGLDHCYALLPPPPAGVVRLSVIPAGRRLSLQWQAERAHHRHDLGLPADKIYSLVADFRDQLDDATGWQQTARTLHDLLFGPLADALSHARLLEVDATGLLGRIPVWLVLAQSRETPPPPVRYIMEISPTAGASAARSDHLHANAITTGPLAELSHARSGTGAVLSGKGFTRTTLLARLNARPASLSIAAHYEIEPTHPELSALILGDGKPLSLPDLARADFDLEGMTHVIAAACSSGQRDVTEGASLSLASLVLEKGAGCFIGALWDVPESAAADFLRAFWEKQADFPRMDLAAIVAAVQADALQHLHHQPVVENRTGGIGTPSSQGLAPHWAAFAVFAGCNGPQPCA